MRYFALSTAKGWIEIRKARKPPHRHESSTVVGTSTRTQVKRTRDTSTWTGYRYDTLQIPIKLKVVAIRYIGGHLLRTLTAAAFTKRTGISLRYGSLVELLPEQAQAALTDPPKRATRRAPR